MNSLPAFLRKTISVLVCTVLIVSVLPFAPVIAEDVPAATVTPTPTPIPEPFEPACEAITQAPQVAATMRISGGSWQSGNFIDLTERVPPRTLPQADDVVLVDGDVSANVMSVELAGLVVAANAHLTVNGSNILVNGPVVNSGSITDGSNLGHIHIRSGGAYNLGSWTSYYLALDGGATAAERRTIALMAGQPFGMQSVVTNGFLEISGCARLPGLAALEGNLLINEPHGLGLEMATGGAAIGGSGFLTVTGGRNNLSTFLHTVPEPVAGPLRLIRYESSDSQPIWLDGSWPVPAEEIQFKGGMKLLRNSGVLNGRLTVWPGTTVSAASSNQSLTVNGSVENQGNFSNDFGLTVKVTGDIVNDGSWGPATTELLGSGARSIGGSVPLGGNFKIPQSFLLRESAVLNGGVTFGEGLSGAYLSFPEEVANPVLEIRGAVNGTGGLTRGTLLLGGGEYELNSDLTADTIRIASGLKRINQQKVTGKLLVEQGATVLPITSLFGNLTVRGDVVNHGTIRDRTDGSKNFRTVTLYITGNISNDGSWTNSTTSVHWAAVPGAGTYQLASTTDRNNWPLPATITYVPELDVKAKLTGTWYLHARGQVGGVWTENWTEYSINVPVATPTPTSAPTATPTPTPIPTPTPTPTPVPNTPPVLTLAGDNPLVLTVGDPFTEPGYSAADAEDGNITDAVDVTILRQEETGYSVVEAVETTAPGTYSLVYSVADAGSLSVVVTRSVVVLPKPTLDFPGIEETAFTDAESHKQRGTDRVKATAGEEAITFKVVYEDGSEPTAKVEAVVDEQIDFNTDIYLKRLQADGDFMCEVVVAPVPGTEERVLACKNSGGNADGIDADTSIEIAFSGEKKEQVSVEFVPIINTSLNVKLEAFNLGGVKIAEYSEAIIASSGSETVSVASQNGGIAKVRISAEENYVSGFVYIKSVKLREAFSMISDPSTADTKLKDGINANTEQFRTLRHFPQGRYEYFFRADNGEKVTSFPEKPLSFETGYSNVVFFPGIIASRLYQDTDGDPHRLWEPSLLTADTDIANLALDENGNSRHLGFYAKDAIDEPLGLGISENVYKKWLEELAQWKADGTINDYEVMPYDWRLPFDYLLRNSSKRGENIYFNSPEGYFLSEVKQLAQSAANGKVTLIGHSMGGFMAKTLIDELPQSEQNIIENLILVASPQLGTPQAIPSLLHGDDQYLFTLFHDNADLPDIGMIPLAKAQQARELMRNMISEYVLLPHKKYFDYVHDVSGGGGAFSDTSVITLNVSLQNLEATDPDIKKLLLAYYARNPITNYADYTAFLLGNEGRDQPDANNVIKPIKANPEVFRLATAIQEDMDAWTPPPGMKVTQIAGWGKYTVKGIMYEAYNANNGTIRAPYYKLDMRPQETIDGDGTVVLPSAVALEKPATGGDPYNFTGNDKDNLETYFVDIKNYNASYAWTTINRKHSNILEIEYLRNLLRKIVRHETINPISDPDLKFIDTTRPKDDDKHIRLSIHSPVAIDVYDAKGNHTGVVYDPNATDQKYFIDEGIPNSSFLFFGEGKYITLPEGQEYRVELKGLDYGSFTYEMEEKQGDTVLSTKTLENIPVAPATKATMTITTLADTSPLAVDADGDGETDASLSVNENGGEISAAAELAIVSSVIGTMEMDAGLKATLLKKLLLTRNFLDKGKPDKAKKLLQKVVKRLEKEIKRNDTIKKQVAKQQGKQDKLQGKIDEILKQLAAEDTADAADDAEDEKTFKELQKEAKKNAQLQKRLEWLEALLNKKTAQWDAWKVKHPGERISTENAQMLNLLIERVIEKLE